MHETFGQLSLEAHLALNQFNGLVLSGCVTGIKVHVYMQRHPGGKFKLTTT